MDKHLAVNLLRPSCTAFVSAMVGLWVSSADIMADAGQSMDEARKHWAYQPVQRPVPPSVKSGSNDLVNAIDSFVVRGLEDRELALAPQADRRTWLKRVTYDLHGLPPSADALDAFEADTSPDAFDRVIEELLTSPRYGERWGRHWLDVARYADTKDLVLLYGRDALRPFAYTYRDYVIRAFNDDLPYSDFIRDQLAADLLGEALPKWRLGALGFLTLGRLFDNNRHDQIDDQIDTVTRGLLGMTVACARCHDHKYDAISAGDYYGLYGVFASTEQPVDLPLLEDPADVPGGTEFEAILAAARKELSDHVDAEYERLSKILQGRIGEYLVRATTTEPDLTETAQFALSLTPDDFRPTLVGRTRRFLEQRLVDEDPIFGPWARILQRMKQEPNADPVERVRLLMADSASSWNVRVVNHLLQAAPRLTNAASLGREYGVLLQSAAAAVGEGVGENGQGGGQGADGANQDSSLNALAELVTGPTGPVWFPHRDTPNHMSRPEKDRYNGLVLALDKTAAHATTRPAARAMVVRDLPEPLDPKIFIRGNPSRPGPPVPRGFLRVLNGGEELEFPSGSGRLDLANAIADPLNPLTARVWVNRVWMHHFGEPLVSSTTDFGARSEEPTHPELLDWLAFEFMRNGWSTKWLHRVMCSSRTYRQSAHPDPAVLERARTVDPDNRLMWQWRRRRLDWEAMRDTILHISGDLDGRVGGPAVDFSADPLNRRRTVYGLIDRQNLAGMFRVFDFAAPDQCAERRPQTTVPQQSLFALNSPLVRQAARQIVARLPLARGMDLEEQTNVVHSLFRHMLGRNAESAELSAVLRFIEIAEASGDLDVPDVNDGNGTPTRSGSTAWEQVAHMLMIGNESVFVE